MARQLPQPELAVGEKVPDGFTSLRGAASMAYENGMGIKYRRHFWYVTASDNPSQDDIVKYVCTSYKNALDQWRAMVEERELPEDKPV